MKKKYVDIIIPVYNNYEFLDECFSSLENQTYAFIHPIIIDDHSTDGSIDKIKKYKKISKYDVTVILNEKNLGVSESRNRALSKLEGEYVSFLDADDVMFKSHIKTLVNLLIKYGTRIAVTGGGSHIILNPKNFKNLKIYSRNDGMCRILEGTGVEGFLWNKIFYVDDIEKFDLKFNPSIYMGEDLLFVCQLYSKLNSQLVYSPRITYYYRSNENSALRKKRNLKEILKQSDNWFKTYDLIYLVLKTFDKKVFTIFNKQYYSQINERIYNMFKLNANIKNILQYKEKYYYFLKEYFIEILFSNIITIKKKIKLVKYTVFNYKKMRKY